MNRTDSVRQLVTRLLAQVGQEPAATDDTALVSSGKLQSIDVIDVINFLEAQFDVDFSDRPFNPDDFDSINAITALIDS